MAKTFKLTLHYIKQSPIDDVAKLTEEFPELKLMEVVDYTEQNCGATVVIKVPIKIKPNVMLYLEKLGISNVATVEVR